RHCPRLQRRPRRTTEGSPHQPPGRAGDHVSPARHRLHQELPERSQPARPDPELRPTHSRDPLMALRPLSAPRPRAARPSLSWPLSLLAAGALLAITAPLSAAEDPLAIEELDRIVPVDFATEILPILKVNCLACHHAQDATAGLALE